MSIAIRLNLAFVLLFSASAAAERTGPGVPAFEVRPGYRVTLAADGLDEARFLEFGEDGTLYVSQPGRGAIVSMKDRDGDGVFETSAKFVSGRRTVHGMHFFDGWLWFTQTGSIHRGRDTNGDGVADEVVMVVDDLPSGGGHWWRSICVTADGFFTSIGDSGNITDESDTERQKIWKFSLDGGQKKLFASGIRNNEKLRQRPETAELYGCDHGSDSFGGDYGERSRKQPITDLNPPCEFNLYTEGGFYGHPFIVGNKLPRLEFKDRRDIVDLADRAIPPAWSFGAHWAPNGFCFLMKDHFPGHRRDALVAFHGSWNSEKKVGYAVERILFDEVSGKPYGSLTIVKTISPDARNVMARPVDCAEAPDGSVVFSCDVTRRIFRISKE